MTAPRFVPQRLAGTGLPAFPGVVSAVLLALLASPTATPAVAQETADVPAVRPAAVVDLRTPEGVRLVGGEWRYRDARVVEVEGKGVGADLRATGSPIRTLDLVPHAGARDFDDSGWTVIRPDGLEGLEGRRGTGRLSFNWYRLRFTIPERVGRFSTAGSTVVFEIVIDDYAEIWMDGKLPVVLGQSGGPLIRGFNAPNRVVVAREAQPGMVIQLAVLGANGPLSDPPGNFIWVRSATLDFYPKGAIGAGEPVETEIVRLDPRLDALVAPGTKAEKLAGGFLFTEGPVWHPDGYLLFSDPNANAIYRWTPEGGVSVYRTKSGYSGVDIGEYHQPGSNGLGFDAEGRLTVAEHGNRRVVRIERNGVVTVLADRFEGRRLNSPNDLVWRSDGSLYFTDPPFGLPRVFDDPRKELPHSGVYLWRDGTLRLVSTDLTGPNGVAFSPDERYLYVTNWDPAKKVVMRYEVGADGGMTEGRVFFDMTAAPEEEALDGIEVDREGNLYVSGPGGVWVISAAGEHLGTIRTAELPANFAWGDADGRTLYLTARTGLYRIRVGVPGATTPAGSMAMERDG